MSLVLWCEHSPRWQESYVNMDNMYGVIEYLFLLKSVTKIQLDNLLSPT